MSSDEIKLSTDGEHPNPQVCELVFKQILKSLEKVETKLEGLVDMSAKVNQVHEQMSRLSEDRVTERIAVLETEVMSLKVSRIDAGSGVKTWVPVAISTVMGLVSLALVLVKLYGK